MGRAISRQLDLYEFDARPVTTGRWEKQKLQKNGLSNATNNDDSSTVYK